jgi:hypothetical protein
MRLEQVVSQAISQLMGRLVRRVIIMVLLGLFALAAIYHFSVAAILALEEMFGPLYARLIVAGIDLAIALAFFGILYVTRAKPLTTKQRPGISRAPQDVQIAMLIESVLQGYALARSNRAKS